MTLSSRLRRAQGYIELGMWQAAWDELDHLDTIQRAEVPVIVLRARIYRGMGKTEEADILSEGLAKRYAEEYEME